MDIARWLVLNIAILNVRSEIEEPMTKPKRDWAWRRLLENAPPKQRALNYRRPDFMTNKRGQTVRYHAAHPTTPALDRFFKLTRRVRVDGEDCIVWEGGDTFRVDDDTVTTPARFYWEEMKGEPLVEGDKLRRACKTAGCVKHKKLCKAQQSGNSNEYDI
jgi:hypothetical protein